MEITSLPTRWRFKEWSLERDPKIKKEKEKEGREERRRERIREGGREGRELTILHKKCRYMMGHMFTVEEG